MIVNRSRHMKRVLERTYRILVHARHGNDNGGWKREPGSYEDGPFSGARGANGEECDPTSYGAVTFNVSGAITRAMYELGYLRDNDAEKVRKLVYGHLNDTLGGYFVTWEIAPSRSLADVHDLLRKSIADLYGEKRMDIPMEKRVLHKYKEAE